VPPLRLLILDACVLIDYCKTERSILKLAAGHVGQLHVATPVFEEVEQLDHAGAADLGLVLVDPPLELAMRAATRGGRLSFQDRLCLLLAKENGWTCVSNDTQLRGACESEGLSVLWGLEILVLLVEAGATSAADAKQIAEAIHDCNRFITSQVLKRFVRRIDSIKGRGNRP
jgi:hypothetical protein